MVIVGDLSLFHVAEMASPRLPTPDVACLGPDNKAGPLFSTNKTYISFWRPPPSGWRHAARACEVEWSRSSGSCVTHRPDVRLHGHLVGPHPHISSSSAAARSDEGLVAVDYKKNIRAMSRKGKMGRRGEKNRLESKRGESRVRNEGRIGKNGTSTRGVRRGLRRSSCVHKTAGGSLH